MNRFFRSWQRVSLHRELAFLGFTGIVLLLFPQTAPALESSESLRLGRFEQQFFARSYSQESLEQRLNRLEDVVYGKKQAGTSHVRASRILQALEKQYAPVLPPAATSQQRKAQDATDYPMLTAVEETVFKQTYSHESISQRLSRLEMQTFHMTYPRNTYADRVDRLLDHYPNAVRMAQLAQLARERQNAGGKSVPVSHPELVTPSSIQRLPPLQMPSSTLAQVPKTNKRRVFFARKTNASDDTQTQFGFGSVQGQSTQYSREMMEMLPPQIQEQMGYHPKPAIQKPLPAIPAVPLNPQQVSEPVAQPVPSSPGFLGVPLR